MEQEKQSAAFQKVRNEFIAQWGVLGTSWGINRTMAQIHAYLMVAHKPLSTQEVMDELEISRGNANKNLRELVSWGLIRALTYKGDRKEYSEAEKDVWKIFCIISRERKRREIVPALQLLRDCKGTKQKQKTEEERVFYNQISQLEDVLSIADSVLENMSNADRNKLFLKVPKRF